MKARVSRRFRPEAIALEPRIALSATGSNIISSATGTVGRPGASSRTTALIASRNLAKRRHATLLAIAAAPSGSASLRPRIPSIQNGQGARLPIRQGVRYVPGRTHATQAYTKVAHAGPITTTVTGRNGTVGTYTANTRLLGDLNGDGTVDQADLNLFPGTYLARYGGARYNANADANQNGQIGQDDARALLHNLTPLTAKIPLQLELGLTAADTARGSVPQNSGGVTHKKTVTIEGKTTPGSLIFTDSGLGDYTFRGSAVAADEQGRFQVTVTNKDGINQFQFLVLDPFGQQTIRAFPIYWMGFAQSAG